MRGGGREGERGGREGRRRGREGKEGRIGSEGRRGGRECSAHAQCDGLIQVAAVLEHCIQHPRGGGEV